MFCRSLFVLFLLAIVLYVLRYTDSYYPFGIFKLFYENVRTLSLIVCTFTYLLIGAAVFDALESDYELENRRRLFEQEREIREKYNISDDHFKEIRINVIRSRPYQAGTQWKFTEYGNLYYVFQIR
jgi:hypothetical protein